MPVDVYAKKNAGRETILCFCVQTSTWRQVVVWRAGAAVCVCVCVCVFIFPVLRPCSEMWGVMLAGLLQSERQLWKRQVRLPHTHTHTHIERER